MMPEQLYPVFVTQVLMWKGKNPDDAANKAAAAIGHAVQDTAEFYEPCCMLWGGVEDA
jgi:hypothetical protein